MAFKSLLFAYKKNGKYQQLDFKYLKNKQCKNTTIYGCKEKNLGLYLLKALTWTLTDTTLNPKGNPFEEIPWKIHTCVTCNTVKDLGKKNSALVR